MNRKRIAKTGIDVCMTILLLLQSLRKMCQLILTKSNRLTGVFAEDRAAFITSLDDYSTTIDIYTHVSEIKYQEEIGKFGKMQTFG